MATAAPVTDIETYLADQAAKTTLRFLTCGSVDDGKSTLIGRLLYDSKLIFEDQLAALEADSRRQGTQGGEIDFALLVDGLAAEREQGIAEIQQQIGEVNEIFQDLAVLVNEQGQMIDDIEANIVSTAVRTKDARRVLTKADKSQKAARNKMICLAIVIAVVLIVLILFLLQ